MIAWYASLPHYAAHLAPIRTILPGPAYGRSTAWGEPVDNRAPDGTGPVVVAGAVDAGRFPTRPVVLVDHGAGQSYTGDPAAASNPSYAGGAGLDHVALFVCPNDDVAARWQAAYPAAATVVAGCARLDQHLPASPRGLHAPARVAVTFHWDCRVCPESRSGWKHWREQVADLIRHPPIGVNLRVHTHPRAHREAQTMRMLGGDWIDDADELLAWADVVVADNTSLLYEACAVGARTLVLNAPWYRRDVEHGLRFWSHVPGPQVHPGDDLRAAVFDVCSASDPHVDLRAAAARRAYGHLDGHAAARAAEAIAAVG